MLLSWLRQWLVAPGVRRPEGPRHPFTLHHPNLDPRLVPSAVLLQEPRRLRLWFAPDPADSVADPPILPGPWRPMASAASAPRYVVADSFTEEAPPITREPRERDLWFTSTGGEIEPLTIAAPTETPLGAEPASVVQGGSPEPVEVVQSSTVESESSCLAPPVPAEPAAQAVPVIEAVTASSPESSRVSEVPAPGVSEDTAIVVEPAAPLATEAPIAEVEGPAGETPLTRVEPELAPPPAMAGATPPRAMDGHHILGIVGGQRYYSVAASHDEVMTRELWIRRPGEVEPVVLAAFPASQGDGSQTRISHLREFEGLVYFHVNDTLWVTDGTPDGTCAAVELAARSALSELLSEPVSTAIVPFPDTAGKLIFTVDYGEFGEESWVGTGAGQRERVVTKPKSSATIHDDAVTEGRRFNRNVAVFSDVADQPCRASIDWGDGTTTLGTLLRDGTSLRVAGEHGYARHGTYPVIVSLLADGAEPRSHRLDIRVRDAGLIGEKTYLRQAVGREFTGVVATFQDRNPLGSLADYTASIDWGDGETSAAEIQQANGTYAVSGTHTYRAPGVYSVQVRINDHGERTTITSTIRAESSKLAARGLTAVTRVGSREPVAVAAFRDSERGAKAEDFVARIDWTDGLGTNGSIEPDETGSYRIRAAHCFERPGAYTIRVTIHDATGRGTTTVGTVRVLPG